MRQYALAYVERRMSSGKINQRGGEASRSERKRGEIMVKGKYKRRGDVRRAYRDIEKPEARRNGAICRPIAAVSCQMKRSSLAENMSYRQRVMATTLLRKKYRHRASNA